MGKIINDICINFVLGIQYFRIIPPRDEWAEDFAHIKEIGLDTVKIEAVWSQIESIPGKYEWNEIDGLMDLADKTGLKVLLTLTFETIPDAIFNVSNAFVMDLDRRQEPVKRGFGGVWRHQCCWDNPLLLRHVEKYILTAVRRYRRHPALLFWDVFQEIDIPECTCGYTKKSYRQWLKAKYKDIRKVNKIYGERYRSFADAEPPYSRTSLEGQNYLNYTLFRAESLAKRIRWLNSLVKSLDKQHPVTAHAHSGTLNLPNEAAHDDWLAGREVDFYGTSTHEFNSAHDNIPSFARAAANLQVQSSAARDKNYYWVTELSAGPAFGAGVIHRRLNERELSYNLWFSVAGGAKGIFLWQFKPERLFFHETPSAWGLCNLDGGETYRTKELREFIKILKKKRKAVFKDAASCERIRASLSP
ncbi:MAG: beta-galactosidase [Candidatus Omnitrophica bacterium]|nr:beta-galactosidase [Candidatus Omnitrophota bacterium]